MHGAYARPNRQPICCLCDAKNLVADHGEQDLSWDRFDKYPSAPHHPKNEETAKPHHGVKAYGTALGAISSCIFKDISHSGPETAADRPAVKRAPHKTYDRTAEAARKTKEPAASGRKKAKSHFIAGSILSNNFGINIETSSGTLVIVAASSALDKLAYKSSLGTPFKCFAISVAMGPGAEATTLRAAPAWWAIGAEAQSSQAITRHARSRRT